MNQMGMGTIKWQAEPKRTRGDGETIRKPEGGAGERIINKATAGGANGGQGFRCCSLAAPTAQYAQGAEDLLFVPLKFICSTVQSLVALPNRQDSNPRASAISTSESKGRWAAASYA